MRPEQPSEHRDRRARTLFLLALAVAAVALIGSLVSRGGSDGSTSSSAVACRIPAGARAGAETPPALVARIVEALPAPDVTFTREQGGSTVYDYCFNMIDGRQLTGVVRTLDRAGYTRTTERNPIGQVLYRSEGATPYGVSLTVTGTLDASNPGADQRGGLSVVWVDSKPG